MRAGVRPRSYRGTRPRFASGTLMSLRTTPPLHTHQAQPKRAGAPSESDIRVPSRVLSAAKQGESGASERVGSPVGAQEGAHRPLLGGERGRIPLSVRNRTEPGMEQESTKEAPPPTSGDDASFVRTGSAEKLSLPRRTQPESAHARERRQPDRG